MWKDFYKRIGLHNYCQIFKDNKIDGNMLEAIIHPTLGEGLMKNLGIVDENGRMCLVKEIYKIKFQGYED